MNTFYLFFDFFLHIDKHLDLLIQTYGLWSYLILFLIVFCETGLVVTPFLPGDSLLFAAGVFAGRGSLEVHITALLLFMAAVLGDAVNYAFGKYMGPRVFQKKDSRIFKQVYLERTKQFYVKYGSKTIVIARFVPIIRTFAPFLAGVGRMHYRHFAIYNILGAFLWVFLFVYGGYLFGELEMVKNNFSIVILVIIIISIIPAVIETMKARKEMAENAIEEA